MLRIVVTGPESCGKTTLVKALAAHYKVGFASEYAREYLEKKLKSTQIKGADLYDEADLNKIYHGQLDNEKQLMNKIVVRKTFPLMICDTDILTVKIWHEEVFKTTDSLIYEFTGHHFNMLTNSKLPVLYLLCSPEGIEWQPDSLRENPNDRDRLFDIYQKNLVFYKQRYFILRGPKEKRLADAIEAISRILNSMTK
jgi:HTH-type transcriptional regulator, transcriptional repressor of NAD biosynthesis genes